MPETLEDFRPEDAWQPYRPDGDNPWDKAKVAHLHRRAGFGADWRQLNAGAESNPGELVEQLLRGDERAGDAFAEEVGQLEEGVLRDGDQRQLKALWLYRMLFSPHPLRERMTLFWHDHFATSNAKVNDVRLMQRQNETLRRHALASFGPMLHEITVDPAMILWLDSNTNKKGRPNENYAREVFELFSLGVGNYTEQDIQQAARALTGWDVADGRAVFRPDEHDDGEKTILGNTGNWGAADVVRIALMQPACAMFLTRKLFQEFVSDTADPPDDLLRPLAEQFRARNYDIGWIVGRILQSRLFYSPAAIGQRVKSPVEFAVGTVRVLEGTAGPARLADVCDRLGQSLFYPPSVKGWDGGPAWLNSTTLLNRQNLAFELTSGSELGLRTDPARLAERYDVAEDEELARFFLDLFLQQPEHPAREEIAAHLRQERDKLQRSFYSSRGVEGILARTAAHLVLTQPEYQLA